MSILMCWMVCVSLSCEPNTTLLLINILNWIPTNTHFQLSFNLSIYKVSKILLSPWQRGIPQSSEQVSYYLAMI